MNVTRINSKEKYTNVTVNGFYEVNKPMTIHCTDCHGELDPAYFDTRCRDCGHAHDAHVETDIDIARDGYCAGWRRYHETLDSLRPCDCGEWRQKVLLCETCEARARSQDSYDNLTPWQQWSRR